MYINHFHDYNDYFNVRNDMNTVDVLKVGCTRSVLLFQNRLMLQVRLITSIPRHRHRNTFSEEKGQLSHILTPVMNKTFGYY